MEAGRLAIALNRTLVEPCVYDGGLASCAYGRVMDVGDGSDPASIAMAEAGEEPDRNLTSRLTEGGKCLPGFSWGITPPGPPRVLPMRAYYDWAWLSKTFPIIRYHDWERQRITADKVQAQLQGKLWVDEKGIIEVPGLALNGIGREAMARDYCDREPYTVGGFRFTEGHTCPPGRGQIKDEDQLFRDGLERQSITDLFVTMWVRRQPSKFGRGGRNMETLPPFNPIHYAAARGWAKREVRRGHSDGRYGVLQWRSQGRNSTEVAWCASALATAVSGLPRMGAAPGGEKRLVLFSDVPATENQCGIWDHTAGSSPKEYAARVSAVAAFAPAFSKYDSVGWRLDAGIVALREAALALNAEWYFTCSGHGKGVEIPGSNKVCGRCFMMSGWVAEIIHLRQAAGKPVMKGFDHLVEQAALVQPPLPAA